MGDTNALCQLYCADDCQFNADHDSEDDDSITSQSLTERVNSQLFIVREKESGEEIWRLPIQNVDAVSNHLIANDHLQYRFPLHSFRVMLQPIECNIPMRSAQWSRQCTGGLFFAAWHEFNKKDPSSPFGFSEFAYCWLSGEDTLWNNDEDKWAFYNGIKLLSVEDPAGWIVYQLMDGMQGEHFASFLFRSMNVLKKLEASLWNSKLSYYSREEAVASMVKLEASLNSREQSLESPPIHISIPIETAHAAINELFYGDCIRSSSTVEDLQQQLKTLITEGHIGLFCFTQIVMKAYVNHMQKQFTLIRLMFETSSSGALTEYYNESKMDPHLHDDDIVGFRELYKILKTLWPRISMKESTLIYREAFDVEYPRLDWGRPSPDGVSFESFLIAADRRCLFTRMRS